MFKRFLPTSLIIFLCVVAISWGCNKLNFTNIGADLIPSIDNEVTIGDTLDIIATQKVFNDTFKIFAADNHVLGNINNDPVFGQTDANIYLQPKPGFYPFYFGNAKDTLVAVDSVVLCLSYKAGWGDTASFQHLTVYEINDTSFGEKPYDYKTINFQPILGNIVGSTTVDVKELSKYIKINNGKDSVNDQIRIKLSMAFAQTLFGRDSIKSPLIPGNNAFYNDSAYRNLYNGLAVVADGASGNALMYISLTDANTRLEVNFRKKNFGTGILDTVYNSFLINTADFTSILPSATSNYIKRTHPASITNPSPLANELYLQTGPGTYVDIKIPGLDTLPNNIIHRAEITIEQIADDPISDAQFSVPPFLYIDLIDTTTSGPKWKPIYHDLNPNSFYDPDYTSGFPYYPSAGIDYNYFGGYPRKKTNYLGQTVFYYNINITRYIQKIVTAGVPNIPNYGLRLFPGFVVIYPQYGTALFPASAISLDNPLAYGRIKIKSGNYPDKKLKMKLCLVYTKL